MNKLKETLDKHPIILIASILIFSVGITFEVMNYFNQQGTNYYERRINELTNTIATLKFGMTPEGYIDVDKLLISQRTKESTSGPVDFIPDLNLFVSSKKIPLEHHISNKKEIIEMFKDTSQNFLDVSYDDAKYNDVRVHHWYNSNETHTIKSKYVNMGMVFPSILIEQYNIDSTYRVGALYNDSVYFRSEDSDKQDRINELNTEFHNDPLTRIFLDLFSDLLDLHGKIEFRNHSLNLHSFDKRENLVHFSIILTMKDVFIDNKYYDKYFILIEDVVVYNKGVVTHISTFVPSENPIFANKYKGWINEWLADLRVVVN